MRLPAAAASTLLEDLQDDDLSDPRHRLILGAVRALADAGTDPEPGLVLAELQRTGAHKLFPAGRDAGVFLVDLLGVAPASGSLPHYIEIVRERSLLTDGAALAMRIQQAVERGDVDNLLIIASQGLADLLGDRDTGPGAAAATWQAVDLRAYVDGTHEPETPRLFLRTDGAALAYAGRVHWLSGEPECLKAWAALLVCLQVMQAGGRALYIDLEDGAAGMVARLLAAGTPAGVILERFDYRAPSGPLTDRVREELRADVARADVVVVDAATESLAAQGLTSEADTDIARWLELLPRWAARLGPAVFVLDHVVKNAETRGRWATGSQHKLAGLDGVAYTLETVQPGGRGLVGRSRLYVQKDRHGQVRGPHALPSTGGKSWLGDLVVDATDGQPFELYLQPPTQHDGPFRPTTVMRKVTDALALAGKPLNKSAIEDRVGGKAAVVRQAIALLDDEGFIDVQPGPNNSQLHHLVRAYSDQEEPS